MKRHTHTFPAMLILLGLLLCLLSHSHQAGADDWPQWRGPGRDGVWNETGIIEKFDTPVLKRRWTVPISSGGYSTRWA